MNSLAIEKTISFGKRILPEYGYDEPCAIKVRVSLKDGRLSICGEVWQPEGPYRKDIILGGQCYDELKNILPNDEKLQRIVEVWKRWHLNDMRAGCEHQRTPEKEAQREKAVLLYRFSLSSFIFTEQNKIKENALKRLKTGEAVQLSGEEKHTLAFPYEKTISIFEGEAAPEAPDGYEFSKEFGIRSNPDRRTLGLLNSSEHPEGLLSVSCEVCGYKYGSAWLKEELPEEIIKEVESW